MFVRHSFSSRFCDGFLLRSCLVLLILGLWAESSCVESCDEDAVGGGAALELEAALDEPATTIGTQFFVLHGIFSPFCPLIGISVIFAELSKRQDWRRVFEELYRHE